MELVGKIILVIYVVACTTVTVSALVDYFIRKNRKS